MSNIYLFLWFFHLFLWTCIFLKLLFIISFFLYEFTPAFVCKLSWFWNGFVVFFFFDYIIYDYFTYPFSLLILFSFWDDCSMFNFTAQFGGGKKTSNFLLLLQLVVHKHGEKEILKCTCNEFFNLCDSWNIKCLCENNKM